MADTVQFDALLIEAPADRVRLVRLNRPDVLNALDTRMGAELFTYFEQIALDPGGVRCIVLSGAGEKAFCAGGDLKQRLDMSVADWRRQHVAFERMARALLACPIPLIGAVNGLAYGGGCEIAGCCDFLYASETARFAMPEARLGIIPGGGGTQTLARAVGQRRALELILTGKPFDAAQALQWGFVNAVFAADRLLPEALATASVIADNAPMSTRQAKQAVARGVGMSLSDGLAFEIEAYNRTVSTQDRVEGVRAFNEKRPPRFTDQ